jgi:hypothetical protein
VTATLSDAVELHPVEVDLLCALAEVRAPFPLDIPSVGATEDQRRHVFGVAREQLGTRGLAGSRGPRGVAATFVRMLRSAAGAVDLVAAENGYSLGAVALFDGLRALLVTQSPDEPNRLVRMVELATDDAVRELLALVPMVPAGGVPAFTMPLAPMRRVFDRLERRRQAGLQPEPLSDNDIDGLLWESGVDERMAARLITAMHQVSGSGQVGATSWHATSERWQRLGDETHWVDTARGRFRLGQSADGQWASVSPFSRTDVRAVLRELAALVRGVE